MRFKNDVKDLGKICLFLTILALGMIFVVWVSKRLSLDPTGNILLGLAYILFSHLIHGLIGGLAKPKEPKPKASNQPSEGTR